MHAFLPLKFLQVDLHLRGSNPARLDQFPARLDQSPARLDLFKELLLQVNIQPILGIEFSQIKDNGILILPTRQTICPFEDWELDFVTQFIAQGNPLFHLSNDFPWTINDSNLGQRFGYQFQSRVMGLDPDDSFDVYPTPNTLNIFDPFDSDLHFSIHNSSVVIGENDTFTDIAVYKKSEIAIVGELGPFGIGCPRDPITGRGAIVALGDSGLLGRPMLPGYTGPGLRAGDNYELIKRIMIWLKNQASLT